MRDIHATIGRLNAQSAVRRLVLDDVTFTYVVDGAMAVSAEEFFPAIPATYWDDYPAALDTRRRVPMSAGGLLVQREGEAPILIDAGMGPVKVDAPAQFVDCGDFLGVLEKLGVEIDSVATVALTHLHADHVGWAFTDPVAGESEPTFPHAKYVLSELEWTAFAHNDITDGYSAPTKLVEPLAKVLHLVHDGDEIAMGVEALVTPGHSPGHTTFIVTTADGHRVVAFGDAFHTPAQISHPGWPSAPDTDLDGVATGRRRIIEELTRSDTVGFGIHFGDQPFGRVGCGVDGMRRWAPVRTFELMPAPRH